VGRVGKGRKRREPVGWKDGYVALRKHKQRSRKTAVDMPKFQPRRPPVEKEGTTLGGTVEGLRCKKHRRQHFPDPQHTKR